MEENRNDVRLTELAEDGLARRFRRGMLRDAAERCVRLQKELLPDGKGFVTGCTACARSRIKACVLLMCGALLSVFAWAARWPYMLWAAGACVVLAAVLWSAAELRRRRSPVVLYNESEICIAVQGKEAVHLSYKDVGSVVVKGDRLALCTAGKNWVFTAEEGENLQQMQALMETLGKACPGRTFSADDPA